MRESADLIFIFVGLQCGWLDCRVKRMALKVLDRNADNPYKQGSFSSTDWITFVHFILFQTDTVIAKV